jgi:2,5-diketo-D-gluconate reductase A
MDTVKLHTGNAMPVLGLGTWQLTRDTAGTVRAAIEMGYRMIDTAADYGTHAGIGEALKRSGIDRGNIYLVTKVEETDDTYEATGRYLKELQVDHTDLMLIHRPPPRGAGEELWRGLIRAKKEGLARDIGISNYSTKQIETLIETLGEVPAVNQIEWSPFGHSESMLRFCKDRDIVIQAYSPLTRAERLEDDGLRTISTKHQKTAAQVLIRWNIQRGTIPLPKANQKDHLRENIDVFGFKLDGDDMKALDALNERYSALGELPYD